MAWIGERVDQLQRRHERLSRRPLDADVLETIDALEREVARWQRLARLHKLPAHPTRIPVDASALVGRVARAVRDERPSLTVELERPTHRRRVLLDAPAAELALRCLVDSLLEHAPNAHRLVIQLDIETELDLELALRVDAAEAVVRDEEECEALRDGLARAGLTWIFGPTHRVRPVPERDEPTTRRYVFPPPHGAAR